MLQLKNQYTYSYGGFEQLVHLSSGIIRNFIELASKMFDNASKTENYKKDIYRIPPSIQDKEIIDYSDHMLSTLDRVIDNNTIDTLLLEKYMALKTLINSFGKAFRLYMESDVAERKKFSFYFDGDVKSSVKDVLNLGVSEGLLHYSTHGSKTGLGRSHKYVMNKMLSPYYKLDAFSFSGYLYVTQDKVELAMTNENEFLKYIKEANQGTKCRGRFLINKENWVLIYKKKEFEILTPIFMELTNP